MVPWVPAARAARWALAAALVRLAARLARAVVLRAAPAVKPTTVDVSKGSGHSRPFLLLDECKSACPGWSGALLIHVSVSSHGWLRPRASAVSQRLGVFLPRLRLAASRLLRRFLLQTAYTNECECCGIQSMYDHGAASVSPFRSRQAPPPLGTPPAVGLLPSIGHRMSNPRKRLDRGIVQRRERSRVARAIDEATSDKLYERMDRDFNAILGQEAEAESEPDGDASSHAVMRKPHPSSS